MNETEIRELKIVDADAHVIEPQNLWTSRMSAAKWGDLIPHVQLDDRPPSYVRLAEDAGTLVPFETWVVAGKPLFPAWAASMAGWHEYAPHHPLTFDQVDLANFDPGRRLKKMDEYGIHSEVLYPNVGIFASAEFLGLNTDPQYALECVKAYNDYVAEEWISVAPDRYIGMATLPFWDLEATMKEIERCVALGHKGLIFSQLPENYGQPSLDSRHWDPLWAAAEEAELPVNFHIGGGGSLAGVGVGDPVNGTAANYAWNSVLLYPGNMRTIGALIFSGICHRFPRLNFVSVESGVGWIPPVLEAMDWMWKGTGVHLEHPEYDLLPSEYFKRQIYGCFWFEERSALDAIEAFGPDNFLYETDFPHGTSMSPGPASPARRPIDFVVETLGDLPEDSLSKILHGNAARLYHL